MNKKMTEGLIIQ